MYNYIYNYMYNCFFLVLLSYCEFRDFTVKVLTGLFSPVNISASVLKS